MQTISVIEEAKLLDTELLGLYAILLALLAAAGTSSPNSCILCIAYLVFSFIFFQSVLIYSRFPTISTAYGLLNLAQNKGWVKKARKSKPVAGECKNGIETQLMCLLIR